MSLKTNSQQKTNTALRSVLMLLIKSEHAEELSEASEPLALSPVQTRVVVALAQSDSVSAAVETAFKLARDDYIETAMSNLKMV